MPAKDWSRRFDTPIHGGVLDRSCRSRSASWYQRVKHGTAQPYCHPGPNNESFCARRVFFRLAFGIIVAAADRAALAGRCVMLSRESYRRILVTEWVRRQRLELAI
jgi:hypothetical protein